MKQKTRFESFWNISIGPWMANIQYRPQKSHIGRSLAKTHEMWLILGWFQSMIYSYASSERVKYVLWSEKYSILQ